MQRDQQTQCAAQIDTFRDIAMRTKLQACQGVCWGPTGDPLSPGVGSVQVTIVEIADTGSHRHATCLPQQVSLPGVSINHNAPGCHVLFSEVEGLCVGRDHT